MKTIYPNEILFEYYDRISKPQDSDVLGNWQVWIYGSDREAFPPHCHVRLPKKHLEFEVSLLNWEVINIKHSGLNNSWDSIGRDIRTSFFEWLTRPSKTDPSISNRCYMYCIWDGLNTDNRLDKWVSRKDKDKLDDDLIRALGWDIDYSSLYRDLVANLSEIYFQDAEARKRLHKLSCDNLLKELGIHLDITDDVQAHNVIRKAELNVYIWSDK